MEQTSPLHSSRRDGQKTYIERLIRIRMKELCPQKDALVPAVLTIGSSGKRQHSSCRQFRQTSALPADLIKRPFRIWPFGF
jgi:hypothetical protein